MVREVSLCYRPGTAPVAGPPRTGPLSRYENRLLPSAEDKGESPPLPREEAGGGGSRARSRSLRRANKIRPLQIFLKTFLRFCGTLEDIPPVGPFSEFPSCSKPKVGNIVPRGVPRGGLVCLGTTRPPRNGLLGSSGGGMGRGEEVRRWGDMGM